MLFKIVILTIVNLWFPHCDHPCMVIGIIWCRLSSVIHTNYRKVRPEVECFSGGSQTDDQAFDLDLLELPTLS